MSVLILVFNIFTTISSKDFPDAESLLEAIFQVETELDETISSQPSSTEPASNEVATVKADVEHGARSADTGMAVPPAGRMTSEHGTRPPHIGVVCPSTDREISEQGTRLPDDGVSCPSFARMTSQNATRSPDRSASTIDPTTAGLSWQRNSMTSSFLPLSTVEGSSVVRILDATTSQTGSKIMFVSARI